MSPTAEISRLATASPFPEPRLHKVIATQVSPYIAEAELKKLFSVAGPPATMRLLHSADGTFVGIVLVEYLDPIQVERVVEKLNGLPVLESNLIVEKVVPSPQVFPRPPTSDRLFKTQRLYAGNLPYDVTVEELETLFSRYGPVKDVHMGRDRKTGLSKGYAFIEYSDEEDARDARDGLQGYELRGRALRLDVNVKQMQTPTPGRNTPATPNPALTPTPANLPLSPPPIGAIRPIGLPAPSATLPKSPIVFGGPLNDPPPIGSSTPLSSSLYAPFPATFGSFPAFTSSSPTSSLFPSRKDSSVWYSPPDLSYANQKRLNVLLCGDTRVGKSTWRERLSRGSFLAEYTPTSYLTPTLLHLSTSHGRIELHLWECAGRGYAQSLASSGTKGQAVILMFSVADRASYNNLDEQHAIVSRLVDQVPTVLVANQTDLPRTIQPQEVLFHRKKNIPLVEMSVKAAQNLYAPIESLLRRIIDPSIQILDQTEPQEIADSLSGLTLHNF